MNIQDGRLKMEDMNQKVSGKTYGGVLLKKQIFPRMLKNAQMQGSRNPEE
jgi:hypothetical protein